MKNRNSTFSEVCYFTWKLEFVSYTLWMIVGLKIWDIEPLEVKDLTSLNAFTKDIKGIDNDKVLSSLLNS